MANIWFELKFREKLFDLYNLTITKAFNTGINSSISIFIEKNNKQVGQFNLELPIHWITQYYTGEDQLNYIHSNVQRMVENFLRDYLYVNKIKNAIGNSISIFDLKDEIRDKIYIDNNKIDFERDPRIIAIENKFAREIVLRQLYRLQHKSGGPIDRNYFKKNCEYYPNSINGAIASLISKDYIKDYDGYQLTYPGLQYIENKLLSPYSDKIFLIAACNPIIEELIKKVYEPATESLNYKLIFQEQNEPKGSIHEDIWNYIESSNIIICDLTNKRPNCFIEYGYALAKNKHIILCVEETEGKTKDGYIKVPFDTQNQKYSFWKKEWLQNNNEIELEKFKQELIDRIQMKLQIIESESII